LKRAITAGTIMLAAVVPASSSAQLSHAQTTAYGRAYAHVKAIFGVHTAGCKLIGPNSTCQGSTADAVILRSTDTLRQMFAPRPVYRPAPTHHYYRSAGTAVASPTVNYNIASTGTSHSSSNGYCGAYQFDQQTWSSIGMAGSPCGASPAQQDAAAQRLYSQRGSQPWPNCGRYAPNWAAVRQCENSGSYAP
jgi:transglycosylase-like protein